MGIPRSGKSTLALEHVRTAAQRSGLPYLVLSTRYVRQVATVPAVASVDRAVEALWRHRRSVRFMPRTQRDVDRLCRALLAGQRVLVLVDEAHKWIHAHSHSENPMLELMRATQHAQTHLYLTTQHFTGDVAQTAISCAPDLYLFRSTSPAVLKVLRRDFGLDADAIATMPQFAYLHHRTGF